MDIHLRIILRFLLRVVLFSVAIALTNFTLALDHKIEAAVFHRPNTGHGVMDGSLLSLFWFFYRAAAFLSRVPRPRGTAREIVETGWKWTAAWLFVDLAKPFVTYVRGNHNMAMTIAGMRVDLWDGISFLFSLALYTTAYRLFELFLKARSSPEARSFSEKP